MKDARANVGIWHETYKLWAGEYESVCGGMPALGLGKAGTSAAVSEESRARQRMVAGRPGTVREAMPHGASIIDRAKAG